MATPLKSRLSFSPEFLLPIAYFLLLLPWLGKSRLLGLDESTYANIVLAEVRDHHWIPQYFQGHPFWDKPPLLAWLQGLIAFFGGMNVFSLRFLSAVAGAVCLHFTFRLGTRSAKSPWAGLLAASLMGAQAHFILYTRIANLDMPLVACLMGAWWHSLQTLDAPRGKEGRRQLLWTGLWMAAAVGIKSWFGFILLPAVLGNLRSLGPRGFSWRELFLRLILPPFMVMTAWLCYCSAVFGKPYWEWALGYDLAGRFSGGSILSPANLWPHVEFYGVLVQEGLAFLWPLLPLGLLLWVRYAVRRSGKGDVSERTGPVFFLYYLLFLLTGIATLINYLLPLVPVAALSTAFIWRYRQEAGVAFAATLTALLGVLNGLTHFEYAGFVLAAVSVVAVIPFLSWRPKLGSTWASLFLMVLVLVSAWKVHAYWCDPPDPNRVWVLAVLAHPARYPGETLLFVGEHTDARVLEFYGDYHVIPIDRLPPQRPRAAILFQEGDKAVFLPAPEESLPGG